jgi:large subunit ribosomal protein L10
LAQVSLEKMSRVEETADLLRKYDVLVAADLNKVGSDMLQNMRRQLRADMSVKCVKNTLMRFSLAKADKMGGEEFMDSIPGQNLFLFTNGNPFKLAMRLDRSKVKVFAKSGDIALNDVVIPSGNTGLSPGPIISNFGALGVRTRIEAGNIWVINDSTVAKTGEEISEELADLLQRMGMRVAEMGLSIKAVYENGVIIPGSELLVDLGSYAEQLSQALNDAFQVAIKASYVTRETLPTLLSIAYQDAWKVALESCYVTGETVKELVAKASAQARSLAVKVGQAQAK